MWSGIIEHAGTFTQKGKSVTVQDTAAANPTYHFPIAFEFDGALGEKGDDGSDCAYTRS